jgi:hypothetical protein
VIVGLNDKPSGTNPATTPRKTHFVVVIGIDTKARVVHLNDSGIKHGRDEQVALAAFETHGPSATTLPSSPSDSAQQERREKEFSDAHIRAARIEAAADGCCPAGEGARYVRRLGTGSC